MPHKVLLIFFFYLLSHSVLAQSTLQVDLSRYHPQEGLQAVFQRDTLHITWQGENEQTFRLGLGVAQGVPTLFEIAFRHGPESWKTLATHLQPEFRIVSGLRRVTQQQTDPLEKLGVPLTAEKLNEIKWDAFWDAPLFVEDEPPRSHQTSVPAAEAFANHPGMPRQAQEIKRAIARYQVSQCTVRTNGGRLEITFPGVEAGIFKGYLQYDIFKGSNLIRQVLMARTNHPSAAFKYDAGLTGLAIGPSGAVIWRDLARQWQSYQLGGPVDETSTIVKGSNRLLAAQLTEGSMAVFPPPHSFYWARESEQNLGYGWYRKDSPQHFSLGIRQAVQEEDPEFYQNFALYNARPGTWQRMPMFIYLSPDTADQALKKALAFTREDQFKALPGYKVMGAHYHVGLVPRLRENGGFDQRLNDITTMKALGVNIYGVIDGVRGAARHDRGEAYLEALHRYYEAARRQSDKDFLVMPNDENSTRRRPPFLGGHYDIMISKPLYWTPGREPEEPLSETHPKYGKIYHLGTPADMMAMCEKENVLISMPHPRSKRSTGYPEAIKDEPHFRHPNYFGLGYRWGMGIDASEIRLGEYRFLTLWDEANNWMAAQGLPPKYALAISESRSDLGHRGKPPYDDTYGMAPVNYLRLDSVPRVDDMSSVINTLKRGEYFVTSGEVLIPFYAIEGRGDSRRIIAEVEWTFPLDFLEVVWGDGEKTERQIIPATDLPAFGKKRFEIPFDAKGKKWVRLAVWDVATNGAMVQPQWLGPSR